MIYPSAEQFTIRSRAADRTYVIMVAKPRIMPDRFSRYKVPPPEKYPVVYGLDADFGFQFSAQLGQSLQSGEDVPLFYFVGIGYGATDFMQFMELRQRDLTPTVDSKAPPPSSQWGMAGAEKFWQFIEGELKPEIARRYPVDNNHAVITGLSHGGLFTLWTLFTHPDSFSGYIALDPANWDNWVGERIEAAFAKEPKALNGKRVYMGIESPEYSDERLNAAAAGIRDRWLRFCDTLKSRHYEGLIYKCEAHRNESHFSVIAPGTTQGLRWVFPMNAKLAVPLPTPDKKPE